MSNLYGPKLSKVFDKMYQGFIDYDEEYLFYSDICQSNHVRSILEIGCGTGNLSAKFTSNFQEYLGMDYSEHMLSIARKKFPNGHFIHGDMRDFRSDKKIDAALITGRSISYLLSKDDILNTFNCIYNVLHPKGYLIFDCIDGDKFIPYIQKNPTVIHKSNVDHIEYSRTSEWYPNKKNPTIIQWTASYHEQKSGENLFLGKDTASFKVFTEIEIKSDLKKAGFVVLDKLDRPSYAFDTFVIVAKKRK